MNNLRLLAGLSLMALSSGWICAGGQRTVMTIDEIFETAEANSRQLRPAVTAVDEARQEIKEARSALLPDINATMSVSYIGDGFITRRNFSGREKAPIPHLGTGLGINIAQPLYTGGALTGAINLAEAKSTAARYAADFQRDNIRFTLAGCYLDLYKYTNLRKVVTGNINVARKMLDEMHARHTQGTALQNDITRYELMVSNLELELVRIDNTLDILNRNLTTIAGLPDGTVVVPDSTILDRSLPMTGEDLRLHDAATDAPVVNMARTAVDISRKAETIIRSERLPKVSLQAGWTIDGPILVEVPPINRNLSYWWVGVGVSYNISSLFKSDKSVVKSRIATRKAVEQLDATLDDVSLAVADTHTRYLEAYEELKTRSKGVELAERNYNTVATRYLADMALITDMLDAANSRLDAEQQLVNARINIIYYYYKLLFTTGNI